MEILQLKPWEVHEFPWGTAVKHSKGEWVHIVLSPRGQEIDVSETKVILHENGIEFI